jgi:hypothetical protein
VGEAVLEAGRAVEIRVHAVGKLPSGHQASCGGGGKKLERDRTAELGVAGES